MLALLSGWVNAASGSREKPGWRCNDTLKEVIRKMVASDFSASVKREIMNGCRFLNRNAMRINICLVMYEAGVQVVK